MNNLKEEKPYWLNWVKVLNNNKVLYSLIKIYRITRIAARDLKIAMILELSISKIR